MEQHPWFHGLLHHRWTPEQIILGELQHYLRVRTNPIHWSYIPWSRSCPSAMPIITSGTCALSASLTSGICCRWRCAPWVSAKIDELIERSLHEADPSQRQHIYRELQRYILAQLLPMLTLGWLGGWFYVDKRVRNFKPGKLIYEGLTHTTL